MLTEKLYDMKNGVKKNTKYVHTKKHSHVVLRTKT